jgi:hypothetical protein
MLMDSDDHIWCLSIYLKLSHQGQYGCLNAEEHIDIDILEYNAHSIPIS